MPVTFTFYKISERKPEHHREVVWLHPVSSFDYYGFEPKSTTVEYQWSELDEEGHPTGNAICYNVGDPEVLDDHKLEILFDSWYAEDDWLWMGEEDFQEVLEEMNYVK